MPGFSEGALKAHAEVRGTACTLLAMVAPPLGVSFRAFRSTAIGAVLVVSGVACVGVVQVSRLRTRPHRPPPSHAHRGISLPGLGRTSRSRSRTVVRALRSGVEDLDDLYPTFHPVFTTIESRASMAPGADHGQVWLATIDSGRATGTPRECRHHHVPDPPSRERRPLSALQGCAEPSQLQDRGLSTSSPRSHPSQLKDVSGYRLAPLQHIGLENGKTYHLELTVPADLSTDPVRCDVSGGGIEPVSVELHLTGAELAGVRGRDETGSPDRHHR